MGICPMLQSVRGFDKLAGMVASEILVFPIDVRANNAPTVIHLVADRPEHVTLLRLGGGVAKRGPVTCDKVNGITAWPARALPNRAAEVSNGFDVYFPDSILGCF